MRTQRLERQGQAWRNCDWALLCECPVRQARCPPHNPAAGLAASRKLQLPANFAVLTAPCHHGDRPLASSLALSRRPHATALGCTEPHPLSGSSPGTAATRAGGPRAFLSPVSDHGSHACALVRPEAVQQYIPTALTPQHSRIMHDRLAKHIPTPRHRVSARRPQVCPRAGHALHSHRTQGGDVEREALAREEHVPEDHALVRHQRMH